MTRSILPILAVALALCACKHPVPGPPIVTSKAMVVAPQPLPEPVLAPIPFTAAKIHEAFVVGLEVGWTFVTPAQTTYQHWRVESADDTMAEIRFRSMDVNAVLEEPGQLQTNTWDALRKHAEFPAAQTVVADERLKTALGELATHRYTVTGADGAVRTYWFAPSLPGPPVRNTVHEAGVLTFEMQMISREVVP